MRSLTLKLTIAFLFIGIAVVAVVGIIFSWQIKRGFDEFVLERWQVEVVDRLEEHYRRFSSWDNVDREFSEHVFEGGDEHRGRPPGGFERTSLSDQPPSALLDENGVVIWSLDPAYAAGEIFTSTQLEKAVPIEVDGTMVGQVLFTEALKPSLDIPDSPELQFLEGVSRTIWLGIMAAAVLALLLGTLLARTISHPVQEVTAATERVAQGDLGHQVPVRTRDEIGKLAQSFNKMSTDLAQSTQQRRQMTADIAHDLRTPLSIILGYTESLSDGKIKANADIYTIMHDKAKQLQRLIDDLRTLAMADAGELSLIQRLVEPNILLEHTALAHMMQAQAQQVTLHVDAGEEVPPVFIDRERMGQVLGNLVSNALRYTPAGGSITLAAEANEDHVLLRVQDTGSGIDAADLPHIFDRFYRADKSRHRQTDESGLGLAIARSIVKAHGGEITAVSPGPNLGATFIIQLPIPPTSQTLAFA